MPTRRHVRTVTLCLRTSSRRRGPVRLWAFGYADLAALLGVSERVVRGRVSTRKLDPADLGQVVDAANLERERKGGEG